MKQHRLYIIMCILSLLSFAGCRDEEPVQSAEGKRTVTVSLGIAMSRVTEVPPETTYGPASDMKVWIFDENGDPIEGGYANVDNPPFSVEDLQGKLIETVTMDFDVTDATELQLRVLLNSNLVDISYGENSLTLDATTTMSQLDDATFTLKEGVTLGDNTVPMYGKNKENIVLDNKRNYDISIDVERCVGKLELFFTKENENSALTINSIKLEHVPTIGYMGTMPDPAPTGIYTGSEENILSFDPGETSVSILTTSDETLGNFSNDETNFTKLTLTNTYLLENPNGGTWSEVGSNNDYTYPYDEPSVSISDQDTRYVMTVDYSIGGTQKKQVVYLPAIERNVWNKIFARVKGGTLQIQYKAMRWETVVTSIGYAPQPATTNQSPFSNASEYQTFVNGDNYILLPLEKYDNDEGYNTTQSLFDWLFMNPDEGDNEARLCILTRPTYDNTRTHDDLKTGSAGARYYFMLTGPEGATWTAHLSNTRDFAFSNSVSTDFTGNGNSFGNSVRMVTHGIAREQPYIIQIIARNLYTGYKENMSGYTSEEGFDEDGYEHLGLEDDEWEEYFDDDKYLTDWGRDVWNNQKEVSTDFYITVRLMDGTEYELTINPAYNIDEKQIAKDNFPFNECRRYAGTPTRIKIRQVRAQYEWPNLEYLAQGHDPSETDNKEEYKNFQWWMVNSDWNPNHISWMENNIWDSNY